MTSSYGVPPAFRGIMKKLFRNPTEKGIFCLTDRPEGKGVRGDLKLRVEYRRNYLEIISA